MMAMMKDFLELQKKSKKWKKKSMKKVLPKLVSVFVAVLVLGQANHSVVEEQKSQTLFAGSEFEFVVVPVFVQSLDSAVLLAQSAQS